MKHPLRRRIIYLAFQGLRLIVRWLPLSVVRAFGRGLGSLAFLTLAGQRRFAAAHLQTAFGEAVSPRQRQAITRSMFKQLGQTGFEWLKLSSWKFEPVKGLITVEGLDHLKQAYSQGRGVLGISAHFGNWELMPLYLRSLGFEGCVLARRLRYPEYERFLIGMRRRFGVETLERGSFKDVVRLLRENKMIGLLPDQDTDSLDGIFVDFLGKPAYTPVGPAALAVMTGAPIVPFFNVREGGRFKMIIEKPLYAPPGVDRRQAIEQLTQAWSDVMASYIRRFPDHWVWMHRRWKTKPSASSKQQAVSSKETAPSTQHPAPRKNAFAVCLLLIAYCLLLTSGCGKPSSKAAQSKAAVANAPETMQQMSGFTLTGYQDDGSKKWQLEGEGASAEGRIVTIKKPNAIGFDAARTAYLTATIAQVHQDTRRVRMENDVTIHTNEGLWFFTSLLHWVPDKNEMATDQPVRIETDHMLLRGRGLSGFTQLKQAVIPSDIEMVLNPSNGDSLAPGQAQQVTITCDGPLSFDYGNGVATFEQNVHVKDPNGDLYSDKLIAYLDQESHTIKYAEAIGRVRIHQSQNTALSEKAVYEPAIGKITLVGRPSLLIYPEGEQGATQMSFGGLRPAEKKPAHGS